MQPGSLSATLLHRLGIGAARPAAGAALLAIGAVLLAGGGCSSNPTRIIGPGGDTGGKHLVVYATDRNAMAGQFQLLLYDLDALAFRAIRNISVGTRAQLHPALSADGLLIAFQSDTAGSGNDDVYLYGRALASLFSAPGLNTDSSETEPSFSGDASRLLFVRKWNGYRHIRIYDPALDSVLVPAGLDTMAAYNDWSPAPGRTAARIAFVSDRNGNPDVFVYDSGVLLDLADLRSAGNDIEPSLTADGRYLCFASDRAGGAGGYDLYLYDLTTRAFITLADGVNTAMNERHPSVGGGAAVIAFQSDRSGGLGGWDVWNLSRSAGRVGQGGGQSSTAADVSPSLLWP